MVAGGGWPLPSSRVKSKAGWGQSAGGGLEVGTLLHAVPYYLQQRPITSLSKPGQRGAGLGLPAANSLQKGKDEGRQARERKEIRPGSNSNRVADAPPTPAPGPEQPRRAEFRGEGAACRGWGSQRSPQTACSLPSHRAQAPAPGKAARAPVPSGGRRWPARLECRLLPTSPIVHGQPPASLPGDPASPKGWWAAKQVPPTPASELL